MQLLQEIKRLEVDAKHTLEHYQHFPGIGNRQADVKETALSLLDGNNGIVARIVALRKLAEKELK